MKQPERKTKTLGWTKWIYACANRLPDKLA